MIVIFSFIPCLPVVSADKLYKQFGPRSGPTKRRAFYGFKLLDTPMVFLKEFFENVDFEKISRRQKGRQNYPVGKVLKHILSEAIQVGSIVHNRGNFAFSMNHSIHNHCILL